MTSNASIPGQDSGEPTKLGDSVERICVPSIVRDLSRLIESGAKYSRIYDDLSVPRPKLRLCCGPIEQVSPGPDQELYGLRELPNTEWTVYGNPVERRFCEGAFDDAESR